MKKKESYLVYGFILVTMLFSQYYGDGVNKYLFIVAMDFIIFVCLFFRVKINKENKKNFILVSLPWVIGILYTLIVLVFGGAEQIKYFGKYCGFLLLPLVSAYIITNININERKTVISMFLGILIYSIINTGSGIVKNVMGGNFRFVFENIYNRQTITGQFESYVAPIMGLYTIYFIMKKEKKLYILLAAFFMLISNKRIVTGSVVIIIALYYLINIVKNKIKTVSVFLVIGTIIYEYSIVYLIYSQKLVNVMSKVHMNDMGRINIYSLVTDFYNFSLLYIGKGLGFSMYILTSLGNFTNDLHSDILLYYIEFGFCGFLIFNIMYFVILYRVKDDKRKLQITLLILMYNIFLCTFDFPTIIINYTVPLYVIILFQLKNDNCRYVHKKQINISFTKGE